MPSDQENVQFLYLVLTHDGPPNVDWPNVINELGVSKGATMKRWSRLKQALNKGETGGPTAYQLLWLCVKHSSRDKALDWNAIAEKSDTTPGAASKRYSRLKQSIESGTATMPVVPAKESKTKETKPKETKPKETKPKEIKPKESKSDESKPEEPKPDTSKPKAKASAKLAGGGSKRKRDSKTDSNDDSDDKEPADVKADKKSDDDTEQKRPAKRGRPSKKQDKNDDKEKTPKKRGRPTKKEVEAKKTKDAVKKMEEVLDEELKVESETEVEKTTPKATDKNTVKDGKGKKKEEAATSAEAVESGGEETIQLPSEELLNELEAAVHDAQEVQKTLGSADAGDQFHDAETGEEAANDDETKSAENTSNVSEDTEGTQVVQTVEEV